VNALARLKAWFGPVPGSILSHVSGEELARAGWAAFLAATAGGGAMGALSVLRDHLSGILPDPADRPMATAGLALVAALVAFASEVRRRMAHGETPVNPNHFEPPVRSV
jgi:hypothetical protein